MQQLAARDQELEPGSRTQQRVEQRGSRQDLLEVVQNQQRLARVQVLMEALEERIAAEIGQAQAPGEGGRHTGGISNGGEIHKADPVREDVSAALAHVEGQTGLADTRRTGQREQPGRAADEQLANQLQLLRASQEARRFCPAGQGGRWKKPWPQACAIWFRHRMMPPLGGDTSVCHAQRAARSPAWYVARPVVAGQSPDWGSRWAGSQSPDWGRRPGSARCTLLSLIVERAEKGGHSSHGKRTDTQPGLGETGVG